MSWHLTQLNVGRLHKPVEAPDNDDFMNNLDPINALAERSPGFVWRYQTAEGNATATRPFDDDQIIINFSIWESIDALSDYAYNSDHRDFLRRRGEWFERPDEPHLVCWWIPAGEIPTVDDAIVRLEKLRADGPSPVAFTIRHRYPPPGDG